MPSAVRLSSSSKPPAGAAASSVAGPVTVDVTLVWEVLSRTDTGLSAMVHLTLPNGTGVADGDGAPIGGSYPTTLWRTGEVVRDALRLLEQREHQREALVEALRAEIRAGLESGHGAPADQVLDRLEEKYSNLTDRRENL